MATVYLNIDEETSEPMEYERVSIQSNGWVKCWNEDQSTVSYPPSEVFKVERER